MYLPSSRQCDSPSGTTPVDPSEIAANQASLQARNDQISAASLEWQAVLRRDWRSFAGLGPNVAYQVLNAPIGTPVFTGTIPDGTGTPSLTAPPLVVGVPQVVTGPAAASDTAGGRIRHGRGGKSGLSRDQVDFYNAFGPGMLSYSTFTGPLPAQGSVMSLVYGGSPYNRSTVVGTNPPAMPSAQAGYYQGSAACSNPVGVVALPWGEPDYSAANGGGSAAGSSGLSSNLWLWGLLGLAGLAYVSDRSDKKHGRTKV